MKFGIIQNMTKLKKTLGISLLKKETQLTPRKKCVMCLNGITKRGKFCVCTKGLKQINKYKYEMQRRI